MYRARVSFFVARKGGGETYVGAGQEVEDGHELLKGREALFEQVENAAPKPAKKAAKKAGRGAPDAG